jgi:hypothetical protein
MVTKAKKKATVKSKPKANSAKADTVSSTLIDRYGENCGHILYSPYFKEQVILCLNEEAPRNITLGTWKRWGKQATQYKKEMKQKKLAVKLKASVLKYPKAKAKAKKKGGK